MGRVDELLKQDGNARLNGQADELEESYKAQTFNSNYIDEMYEAVQADAQKKKSAKANKTQKDLYKVQQTHPLLDKNK